MSLGRTYKTKTARQYRFPVWLQNKTSTDWPDDPDGGILWEEIAPFYADIQPRQYRITPEAQEETLVDKFEIAVPWRPGIAIYGDFVQRFRTEQENLFYYIESVIDMGATSREFRVVCTQRLEQFPLALIPLLPTTPPATYWVTLGGAAVVRLG